MPAGRPALPPDQRRWPRTIGIAPETLTALKALCVRLGLSEGRVVDRAIAELAERMDQDA